MTAQKTQNADYSGQIAAISKSHAMIEFALDETVMTANENFLDVMGYSLAEIQGRHHSMFVDQMTRQATSIAGSGPRWVGAAPGGRVQARRQKRQGGMDQRLL